MAIKELNVKWQGTLKHPHLYDNTEIILQDGWLKMGLNGGFWDHSEKLRIS